MLYQEQGRAIQQTNRRLSVSALIYVNDIDITYISAIFVTRRDNHGRGTVLTVTQRKCRRRVVKNSPLFFKSFRICVIIAPIRYSMKTNNPKRRRYHDTHSNKPYYEKRVVTYSVSSCSNRSRNTLDIPENDNNPYNSLISTPLCLHNITQ